MSETPWLLYLQITITIAMVLTFIVYYFQLKAMQKASLSQNVLTLIDFLQKPGLPEARKELIEVSGEKHPDSWDKDERTRAERVCATYDIAGILIQQGIVPKEIIVDNWGDSIKKCYNAASKLIKEVREERGVDYWDDFEWLAEQVP